jgi:hypothetical protein
MKVRMFPYVGITDSLEQFPYLVEMKAIGKYLEQ